MPKFRIVKRVMVEHNLEIQAPDIRWLWSNLDEAKLVSAKVIGPCGIRDGIVEVRDVETNEVVWKGEK